MISSLCKSSIIFNRKDYLDSAICSFNFLKGAMVKDDFSLYHCYRNGDASINGLIDDYAFLLKASIDLYEATLDSDYLKFGKNVCHKMINLFWDNTRGSFYATPIGSVDVIVRQKNLLDGAIPSGNSVALYGMVNIGQYFNDSSILDKSNKLSLQLGEMAKKFPINLAQFLANHLILLEENIQIVIMNPNKELNYENEVINYLREMTYVNKSIYYLSSNNDLIKYKNILGDSATFLPELSDDFQIYICKDKTCQLPVSTLSEIKDIMK